MRQATTDRSVRNLGALRRTASTSRVLNLVAIANSQSTDPDYRDKPFFTTPILNEGLLLKHRVRMDERFVFDDERQNSTKIIIPFERTDLRIGGRSFFVGQRGWHDIFREMAGDSSNVDRDIRVLTVIDEIPSLDPFLLREHLGRRGIDRLLLLRDFGSRPCPHAGFYGGGDQQPDPPDRCLCRRFELFEQIGPGSALARTGGVHPPCKVGPPPRSR